MDAFEWLKFQSKQLNELDDLKSALLLERLAEVEALLKKTEST